ncbi:uncharacterized protein PFL1_04047 [Pseudozyma flocculosa PF-1]|uniref:Small ribosomal subunit protein uS13m n=2 Tax=Pseudozyma flocculosa TaxID=84751 RepID=A0A5C3EUY1_9BASI|nr:uncharacterized protein PFL1_04047 [Pseudozyma flocculosa PF-1]EPQ28220.1 hypothetical protein PFL1_04047 [Pseudozyma flocculosa PF-1]SPO35356.1 related to mitochondrial ribosomal protein S13 [Pseudozyma flocculosa]
MYMLGVHLPDHKLVRIALTSFYGISYDTARRICARLQLHERAPVSSLTEAQITQLSAYLSSPGTIPARKDFPTSPTPVSPSSSSSSSSASSGNAEESTGPAVPDQELPPSRRASPATDPLRSIVIEADLRRQLQANIAHHRTVGSYKGRRHAAHLPVRGQRTSTNANTAKKLNRVERRAFTSSAPAGPQSKTKSSDLMELLKPLVKLRFHGSP